MRSWFSAALVLLAACQPVPRPFEQDGAPLSLAHPARALSAGAGIHLEPFAGAPPAFAEAIVAAFAAADLPATTRPLNRASFNLAGEVRATPRDGETIELRVIADLRDGSGQMRARHRKSLRVAKTRWDSADPSLLRALAQEMVAAFDKALREGVPEPPYLALPAIAGSGGPALRQAMARAVAELGPGLALADAQHPATHVLSAEVALKPAAGGLEELALTWRLSEAGGRELGRLDQRNAVPAGLWAKGDSQLMRAIAEAAAEGILDLFVQDSG